MFIEPKFRLYYLLQFLIFFASIVLVDYWLFINIHLVIIPNHYFHVQPIGVLLFTAVIIIRYSIIVLPLFQISENISSSQSVKSENQWSWKRITQLLISPFRGRYTGGLLLVATYLLFAIFFVPMDWSITPTLVPDEFLMIFLGINLLIVQSGISFAATHKINPEALIELSSPTGHVRFYVMLIALSIHLIVLVFGMEAPELDAAAFAAASVGSFLAFAFLIYENVREIGKVADEYIIKTIEKTLILMKDHILLFNSQSRSFESLPFDRGICNSNKTVKMWFAGTQFETEGIVQIPVRSDIILFEDITLPSTENIIFSGTSTLFGQVYIRRIRAHYDSTAIYTIGIARTSANLSVLGMVNERYAQYSLVFDSAPEGFEAWRERLSGSRDSHTLRILTAQRATNMIQGIQLAPEIRVLFFDFIEGYVATGRYLTLSILSSRMFTQTGKKKTVKVLIFGSGRKLRYIIQSAYVSCKNLMDINQVHFCVVTDDPEIVEASDRIRIWGLNNRYRWRIPVSYSNGQLQNADVDVLINNNSGPRFLAEIIESENPDVVGVLVDDQKQNTRLLYDIVRYISNTKLPKFDLVGAVNSDELDEIRSLVGSHTRSWLHNVILQKEDTQEVSNFLLSIGTRLHIPENLSLHISGAMLQSNRSEEEDVRVRTRINIGKRSITIRHLNPFNISLCVSDNPGALSMILDTLYSEQNTPTPPALETPFAITLKNIFAQNCPRFREREVDGELLPSHFVLSGAAYFSYKNKETESSKGVKNIPQIVRASCNLQGCAESNNDWGVLALRRINDTFGRSDSVECNQRAFCTVAFCSDKISMSPPSPRQISGNNESVNSFTQNEVAEDVDMSQLLPPAGGANIKVCLKNLPGATAACLKLLLEAKIAEEVEPSLGSRPSLTLEVGKKYSDIGYIWSCEDIALSDGKPAYLEMCGTECEVEGIEDDTDNHETKSITIDISDIIDAILISPECDFDRWLAYAQGIANILWPEFEVHSQGIDGQKKCILIRRKNFIHLCDDVDCSIARRNMGVMIARPLLLLFANLNIAISTLSLAKRLGTIPNAVLNSIQQIASTSEDSLLKEILPYLDGNDPDIGNPLESWLPDILLSTGLNPYDCQSRGFAGVSGCANPSLKLPNLANRIRVLFEFALLHNQFAQIMPILLTLNNKDNSDPNWKGKYAGCYGLRIPTHDGALEGISHSCVDCQFKGYTLESPNEEDGVPNEILTPYNQGLIPNCIRGLRETISDIRNMLSTNDMQSIREEIDSSLLPIQCIQDEDYQKLMNIIFGTDNNPGRLSSIFNSTKAYLWPVHYKPRNNSVFDRVRSQIRHFAREYQDDAMHVLGKNQLFTAGHAITARLFAVSEVLRFLPLAPGPYVELVSEIEEWDPTWVTTKKKKPLTTASPIDFILKPSG